MISLVYSLAAPLFLLPLEKILPYPYIIEESIKYLLVVLIVRDKSVKRQNRWVYVVSAGLLFTFTESVFYIFNILSLGRYWDFPARLLLTGILHIGTMLIMLWGIKRGKIISAVTILIAIIAHYFFNLAVSSIAL